MRPHSKRTQTRQDKDKNLSKEDETVRGWFETAWTSYPRQEGKEAAWKNYRATVRNDVDRDRLLARLENYKALLAANRTDPKFYKGGGRWFAEWDDGAYDKRPQRQRRAAPTIREAL